jgi:hypothetical protein
MAGIRNIAMPVVSPVPIETKGKNVFKRAWIWLTSSRQWKVEENWFFILPNGVLIVIPAGFIFDGASIPRMFWAFLSPIGILFLPSLVHDFAYKYDLLWCVGPGFGFIQYTPGAGQKYWDRLFLDVAEDVNGAAGIDRAAYAALYCFGFVAWNKNRDNEPSEPLCPVMNLLW